MQTRKSARQETFNIVERAASRQPLVSIPNGYRLSLDRHPHIVSSSSFLAPYSVPFHHRFSLPSCDSSGFRSRYLDFNIFFFHSLPCRISRHALVFIIFTPHRLTARLSFSPLFPFFRIFLSFSIIFFSRQLARSIPLSLDCRFVLTRGRVGRER
jgi:hypothetical protein